jgi:hypothetical protein
MGAAGEAAEDGPVAAEVNKESTQASAAQMLRRVAPKVSRGVERAGVVQADAETASYSAGVTMQMM